MKMSAFELHPSPAADGGIRAEEYINSPLKQHICTWDTFKQKKIHKDIK